MDGAGGRSFTGWGEEQEKHVTFFLTFLLSCSKQALYLCISFLLLLHAKYTATEGPSKSNLSPQ